MGLGRTYNDEEKYRKRFKIAIEGERYRKKLVLSNENLSDKWKTRATKIIDKDVNNLKSLHSTGDTGISVVDRLWREAHADPDSYPANVLKHGVRRAQEIQLQKLRRQIGKLRARPEPPAPVTTYRWRRSRRFYKLRQKERERRRAIRMGGRGY